MPGQLGGAPQKGAVEAPMCAILPDVAQDNASPSPVAGYAADELARRVAHSLTTAHPDTVATALAACVRDPACYEASVRGGPDGAPRMGRMLIEQVSPAVLHAIAEELGVVLPATVSRWIDLARQEGVALFAGWDLRGGGATRCAKVYLNTSDASRAVRARVYAALAAGVTVGAELPAVVGMNARADGVVETKLYLQYADAATAADAAGTRAQSLATAARAEGAAAGGVLSFDIIGSTLQARAFFVALREPPVNTEWQCVQGLPGYDAHTVESLLPFDPAPPRSVGIALAGAAWTLYYKPRGSGRAPETLEPAAIFRAGGAEVGVFIEPTERALRAFRRTERHAISVRVRNGAPAPSAVEALVDWFTARLRAAERDGAPISTRLGDPPVPWRTVNASALRDRRER